jgi:hypothetical protein
MDKLPVISLCGFGSSHNKNTDAETGQEESTK